MRSETKRWTIEEDSILRQEAIAGGSVAEIAGTVGRTEFRGTNPGLSPQNIAVLCRHPAPRLSVAIERLRSFRAWQKGLLSPPRNGRIREVRPLASLDATVEAEKSNYQIELISWKVLSTAGDMHEHEIIDNRQRPGRLRLVFRNLGFIGSGFASDASNRNSREATPDPPTALELPSVAWRRSNSVDPIARAPR